MGSLMTTSSTTTQASTWSEILQLVQDFVQEDWTQTWFFLDLDETLVRPSDPALDYGAICAYWDGFVNEQHGGPTAEPDHIEAVIASAVIDTELIDAGEGSIEAVKSFQEKGAKAIGLTATLTGPLPPYEQLDVARCAQCRSLGLHFDQLLPGPRVWTHFQSFHGQFPCYREGILFANGAKEGSTKGQVLCQFLREVPCPLPRKIVFVDDTRTHVESVANELAINFGQIQSLGIVYLQKKLRPLVATYDDFKEAWLPTWERITLFEKSRKDT